MNKMTISASRKYDVFVGSGILESSGKMISEILDDNSSKVFIVTDDNVAALYLDTLKKSLENAGIQSVEYVVSHGEKSKNLENYIRIIQMLYDNDFCRSNAVVALGGGVVGDLAGFAAATYMRGMRLVQIPTTVMAAVDSSVGGKTAVDFEEGKNLIGTFYQPALVICDVDTFDSLPADVFRDGCSEIVKYGVLASEKLFDDISDMYEFGGKLDEDIIARCISVKKYYVESDEFDRGKRRYLNLGHTIGHAIEVCSDYTVSHGAAVAGGLILATRIALKLGICDPDCPHDIIEGLRRMGFAVEINYTAAELMRAVKYDKKRVGDSINLILPKNVGECINHTIRLDELDELLHAVLG